MNGNIRVWGILDGFSLKLLAVASMFCDHLGKAFFPQNVWLNACGRLAFPLFAFLLVEGFIHTKDVKKYLLRLGGFALISEIPYDLFARKTWFSLEAQNVFWTLFLGILLLYLYQRLTDSAIRILAMAGLFALVFFLRADYGPVGLAVIFVFYYFRSRPVWKYTFFAVLMILMGNNVQLTAIAAVIPMVLYSGKRGISCKYLFYIFYPGHLAALASLIWIMYPGIAPPAIFESMQSSWWP